MVKVVWQPLESKSSLPSDSFYSADRFLLVTTTFEYACAPIRPYSSYLYDLLSDTPYSSGESNRLVKKERLHI